MKTPDSLRRTDEDDRIVREYDYGNERAIVVDLGPEFADAAVDVADGTAIVVAGDEQFEFDVPADAAEVTANNGVVTIIG